jgi:bifunctional DNA-binding transcriptional regulator/antitoxin component of YhaV-PrlF toxin-antitoxin module
MTTLKLHYEGWLALPTSLRQKLGLKSGDQLEAELVRGTIVLRRAGRPTAPQGLPDEPEPEPERAAAPMAGEAKPQPAAAAAKAPPATRRTARKPAQASLPAALKGRGRRKVKEAAEDPASRS